MRINYNYTGDQKKRMVKAIGEALEEKPVYLGTPSCAYQIAEFTVTREGNLEFPDDTDTEIVNGLLDTLEDAGFAFPEDGTGRETDSVNMDENASAVGEMNEAVSMTGGESSETERTEDAGELTISLPTMEPAALERLQKLIDSKASLIRKALDVDRLTIQIDGDKVSFPWWKHMPTPDETTAYIEFLAALCKQARESKRVTATEKPTESGKYSFRIFLIRLGFNGPEHKVVRHILLQRLSGHAAFRNDEEERKFREHRKAMKIAAMEHQEATVAREETEGQEVVSDETAE